MMSAIVWIVLFVAAGFFIPPLISGIRGASIKFTVYYAIAIALVGYFAKILNYVHDGKANRQGLPSVTGYACSEILMTIISYIGILGLSVLMYWTGAWARKLLIRRAFR
jgi:predicted ABC-type exoprotein transport system permease subunit